MEGRKEKKEDRRVKMEEGEERQKVKKDRRVKMEDRR